MQVKIHDVIAARKKAMERGGPLAKPVLRYTDGTTVLLMDSGQRVRVDPKIRGKAARRLRIKNKHAVQNLREQLAKEGTLM